MPCYKKAFTKTLHYPGLIPLNRNNNQKSRLKTIFLAMKLIVIMMLVTCLTASAKSFSQVSISLKDAQLEKVFALIERQTGYYFVYSKEVIKNARPVTIDVKNGKLNEVLNLCFKEQPLLFSITDRVISVKAKAVPVQQEASLNLEAALPPPPPPPVTITGIVTDEKNEPVTGASVMVKGTSKGTTTDDNGNFTLTDVDKEAILVISGTNIETVEIKVGGRTSLNIATKIKVSDLDAAQLIGYGTTTKRLKTGTIATIKGDEIKDRPVTSVISALQGKMAGVIITNSNTSQGSAPDILIRGQNSITSGTNPLIIVDGVVVNEQTNSLRNNGGGNTLNFINPADIETIDVLKDADATGIYGSRGTNGVILITTKKATLGKNKFTANVATGWKSPTMTTKRMNTPQYLQMRKDAFAIGNATATSAINPITPTTINAPDLLVYDQNAYIDFTKLGVQNPAPDYRVELNFSGGTKAANFVAAANYYKSYDSYLFSPFLERMTGRLQFNHASFNNKFNLHIGTIIGRENQNSVFNNTSAISAAMVNAPNFPLYKNDGSLFLGPGYSNSGYWGYNPYVNETAIATSKTNNMLVNTDLSYAIIKGLVAKLGASYMTQATINHQLYPSTAVNIQDLVQAPVPYGSHNNYLFSSVNIEPQLSYTRTISKANIAALAGTTFLDKKREFMGAKVSNPGNDGLLGSLAAGQPTTGTSENTQEKFQSVFARLSGDWDKKYVLNLSFRRDGSSRFGPNNRFANFGSIGGAWIFTSEPFLKNMVSVLSFGKLRGSYGTTGNNNIADYQYLGMVTTPALAASGAYPGYAYGGPLAPSSYPNADVKWETTTKRDIGMELGFLKNRIQLTATWYRSTTTDLLVSLPLAPQSGFSSYIGNFPGVVQNTGWEFELATQNLGANKAVKWTTKFMLSNNKNILKSYPNLAGSVYAKTLQEGRALNSNILFEMPYRFAGINPDNGLPITEDVNKDGVVNTNDYLVSSAWFGTARPTLYGGLTNTVSYKGFTLDVFFQFSNGIFSKWNFGVTTPIGTQANPAADVTGNYWTKAGDVSKYPRLYTNTAGVAAYTNPITQFYPYSTAGLYKGYYVRLKNLQLSYSLPASLLTRIKAGNASLFVSGENLAVYTPEKLYKDPEITSNPSAYGLMRNITTGIRIDF